MAGNYIPAADAAFDTWQANLVSVLSGNLAAYGLVAGDLTPITAAQTAWSTGYAAQQTALAAAQAATETKDGNRQTYEDALRVLVRGIQARPSVSDPAKAAAGIPVRDTEPTPRRPADDRPGRQGRYVAAAAAHGEFCR